MYKFKNKYFDKIDINTNLFGDRIFILKKNGIELLCGRNIWELFRNIKTAINEVNATDANDSGENITTIYNFANDKIIELDNNRELSFDWIDNIFCDIEKMLIDDFEIIFE